MDVSKNNCFPNMLLSHVELYVQNLKEMEKFYTQKLGFVVSDRSSNQNGMVFLSRSPNEHHQIVLNPVSSTHDMKSPVDHISFRVSSLEGLRFSYASLRSVLGNKIQTVSHGSSWSIYFRDPENNRFEIFTETPWYVNQPCRFEVDLNLSDKELLEFTLKKIETMSGFTNEIEWRELHENRLQKTGIVD